MPTGTVQKTFELALQHHRAGRLTAADAIYRQILAAEPRHGDALHLLGVIASEENRDAIAVDLIRQAIAILPGVAMFHYNLGYTLQKQGLFDEAIAAYRRALELQPNYAEACNNLGIALTEQGRLDEAVAAYREALRIQPLYAEAHSNLGNVLRKQGRPDEAITACRRALELRPDYSDALTNLGVALGDRGRLDEALAAYRGALGLKPDFMEAHYNMGNALREQGHADAAATSYRRALELKPDFAEARNNLGNALKDQGRIKEAVAEYRRALECGPPGAQTHSNVLLALHYAAEDSESGAIFAEHCRWEQIHARPLAGFIAPHPNDPSPERPLRMGYVSPDFREHAVAFFLEALLAGHDARQTQVYCYADTLRADAVTARLREHAGTWRKIAGLGDAQAAELIREDRIDILVDLAGHTAGNRLLAFARKPAPVQVTYLGYCDTTGMSTMDYRLTDAHADPPGTTEHLHTEQLVRLPECAWCFRPSDAAPPVAAAPVLHSGCITFGCFNALPKITEEMLALWSQILQQVPGSRLVLKNFGFRDASTQERMRSLLQKAGIAPERVELLGHTPTLAGHLATYSRVDIALDTFPYHGTTTTCEALWMGVPVVTLAGRTHAARVGVSLLRNLGLPGLIARSAAEYVQIAASLAADLPRLAQLRSTLRGRMAASPLTDGPRFARHVEHACRQMWRAWCARQIPGAVS